MVYQNSSNGQHRPIPARWRTPGRFRTPAAGPDAGSAPVRLMAARRLVAAISRTAGQLLAEQKQDGHWCFELEADCTIPAEYILMMHYLDEIDARLQAQMAAYIGERQLAEGGWPLYTGGAMEISCSVKCYYALKLAGMDPDSAPMQQARKAILAAGGAARSNVFTRITLALFKQLPWRAVPFMPVELMLLPAWFPFHLSKVSYWSRTVAVPLLVLGSLKPAARNPDKVGIAELFTVPPDAEQNYFPVRSRLNRIFLLLDQLARRCEPWIPAPVRRRAVAVAEQWIIERADHPGGLGAIFPAMVNALLAFDCLGYAAQHPMRRQAGKALRDLVVTGETAYCQPCVSPVWDTALACLALQEARQGQAEVRQALTWLERRQLRDTAGDWQQQRPGLAGGGWPFQYHNAQYPDTDDTAVVAWALAQAQEPGFTPAIAAAQRWVQGMQCRNGGFAAFDADNARDFLNHIPFADHGALLDPPTSDVSARCLTLLSLPSTEKPRFQPAWQACLAYLRREQEASGAWFGRWGTNYIYGTWSVLMAFEQAGIAPDDPQVQRAVRWLEQQQNADGGWGESNDSYIHPSLGRAGSTSFQTAWALLGLMAAGVTASPALARGVDYLLHTQEPGGGWRDAAFTAPGFPRVFYLKYHGYSTYFPLWALARYRNLLTAMP